MNIYFHLLVFLLILFLYVHLVQQYKRSEDLEVYEMDFTDNKHLQDVCDIKQPVLFEYKSINTEFFHDINVDKLETLSGSLELKIKENEDYWKDLDSIDYVVLPLSSSQALMTTDTHSKYFTENNETFIEDANLIDEYRSNDTFLKPPLCVQTKYDIYWGSKNTETPLRYHTYHRHFICVNSGKIHVKMTPWKSSKYLYPNKDYDNYEFTSPINVWKPQRKYFHEMDKLKFLEFDVLAGSVVYIPSYWWYSIKYDEEPTVCSSFVYNNIMNCISNLPNWVLYYLQQSNTKTKVVKTLDTNIVLDNTDSEKQDLIIDSNNEIENIKAEIVETGI